MALESCVYGKIEAQGTHMLLFLGEISEIRFEARNIISITSSLTFSFVFFFQFLYAWMYSKVEAWGFAISHKKALDVYFLVLLEVDFLFFPQQLLLSVRLFAIFQCLENPKQQQVVYGQHFLYWGWEGKKGIWKCTQHTITTRQWWKKSRTFDHRKLPLALHAVFWWKRMK